MKLSDFDYELPKELIAQYPADPRGSSRMLVLNRSAGKIIHTVFKNFPRYIKPSDILIPNDTKVVNARLFGRRATGGKLEIFLIESLGGDRFKALIKPSGRIKEGEEIAFDNSKLKAHLLEKKTAGNIIKFLSPSNDSGINVKLNKLGTIPLPPYIKRKVELLDNERYQTIYAKKEGATASPTAGLHFTEEILKDVVSKGAELAYVTLHVNYGTFAPVKTEDIVNHKMHCESFELTQGSATKINNARTKGGRVFAIGTTSCRVLETCAGKTTVDSPQSTDYEVEAKKGKTDLFIYPGYKFKIVDTLLTNFHFPKSTLLMLVCAFAGKELIFKAYEEAIVRKYRFFSYGDCMLIL
jgi:S-adenosylmethionine:tRNA ribosyltransferase-isomerase